MSKKTKAKKINDDDVVYYKKGNGGKAKTKRVIDSRTVLGQYLNSSLPF